MTTTKVRDSVITLNLTTSNVKKAVKSYAMSKRYINTMMKASVINILYHRLNIDEKEFISKSFNNISFKTFRSKSSNIYIREFHTYMLACKDAVDKGYLREFYLYLIDAASGDIVENYKFSFQYGDQNDPNHGQKEENLIDSTCELLNTLEELGKHEKFDTEIQLKVEFTYFDDTPEDYQPPGFRSVDVDASCMKKLNKKGNSVVIGTLFTGFHQLKCRGKGDIFNFNSSLTASALSESKDDVVDAPQEIGTDSVQVVIDGSELLTEDFTPAIEQERNDANKTITNSSPNCQQATMNDTYISQFIEVSSDEETEINCPCKLPLLDFCTVDQIQCGMCKRMYHTPCQGYLDNTFISKPFRCFYCSGDDDSVVATFDVKQSMSIYRVRFIVAVIYKYGKNPSELKSMFADTVNNFEKLKIFEFKGNEVVKVDMKMLNALFKFDFKMPDVERFRGIPKV